MDATERERWAVQIAVGVPELGWSCCEALFMPILLKLRVPEHLLTVCWLFSPVLGLFLHPCVGELSDKYGRRPWTILFGVLAAIGLVATPLCSSLLSGHPSLAAVAAIIAFGVTDTSHDVLVTPTRAAMNDIFDAEASEKRSAVASGLSKLLGEICATFLQSSSAFLTTASLVAVATATQCVAPRLPARRSDHCRDPQRQEMANTTPALSTSRRVPKGFAIIWLLQFAGWVSICTFSFYFTSVWAEQAGFAPDTAEFDAEVRVACSILIGSSLVFIAAGPVLPAISRVCGGELQATGVSVLVLALVLLSFGCTPQPCAAFCTLVPFPTAYQVVANTPFAWLERQPGFEEGERGRLTGRLNASLAAAQSVTAVVSGPLVSFMGGRLVTAFHFVALLDVVVVAASILLLQRGRWRLAAAASIACS